MRNSAERWCNDVQQVFACASHVAAQTKNATTTRAPRPRLDGHRMRSVRSISCLGGYDLEPVLFADGCALSEEIHASVSIAVAPFSCQDLSLAKHVACVIWSACCRECVHTFCARNREAAPV